MNVDMPRSALLAVFFCACSTAARAPAPPPAPAPPNTPPPGFTALFDGRSLDGWETPADQWSVENGLLVHGGKGKNLVSAKRFRDFELLVDWKIGSRGDSGIYLRGLPQVQIWDPADPANLRNGADKGSGALWNNKKAGSRPLVRADRPIGEWNTFRIRMVGELVWIWLNGTLVVDRIALEDHQDRTRPPPPSGPIELQTHGNPLWFRNVFVREIPSDESAALLTASDESAFKALWNGRDFTGWGGPVDNYEIVHGAIRCKAGKGGTIFAEQELTDFVARVEIKLPPGGNNGLAIRYPGSGDPAYAGMCELQVLDDGHPKYASLDPRQSHGSAYGMAAAHRGYLRPAGDWNFEQVTVTGSRIRVELNGTTILDNDLAPTTEFLDGKAHPGKDRTAGFFGFAGHNDPVMFRNLRVKRL